MITFLAVIYFLKTVLNFDVFSGPGVLTLEKQKQETRQDNQDQSKSSLNNNSKDDSQEYSETESTSNSNQEDEDEDDAEEDEEKTFDTLDKSYDVSAWSVEQTNAVTDDEDDDDDEDADDNITHVTTLSDSSDDDKVNISKEEVEEEREEEVEDSDDGCDTDEECSELLETDWYQRYSSQRGDNKRWITVWEDCDLDPHHNNAEPPLTTNDRHSPGWEQKIVNLME